jgi:hypothetical protein
MKEKESSSNGVNERRIFLRIAEGLGGSHTSELVTIF